MSFEGLQSGRIKFDRLPSSFFTELLPVIDHLGEIKVTLYLLWRLDRMEGDFRYLMFSDFIQDTRFINGLPGPSQDSETILLESLAKGINRGSILEAKVKQNDVERTLYFFNSPKGRMAVESIKNGEWKPSDDDHHVPIELEPESPNIFKLYEENIGPISPLLAEQLSDAEVEFPSNWINEAFRIAVEKNIRNWRYIETILRRWHERGYDVRQDRRDSGKNHQEYAEWED